MLETVLGRKREMLALKAWDMVSSLYFLFCVGLLKTN